MTEIKNKDHDLQDMEISRSPTITSLNTNGLENFNNIILNKNHNYDDFMNVKIEQETKVKLNFSVDRILSNEKEINKVINQQNEQTTNSSASCTNCLTSTGLRCSKLECQSIINSTHQINPLLYHRRSILRPQPQYPTTQSVFHFPVPITTSSLTNFQQIMAHENCRAFKPHHHPHPHSHHIHHQNQTMLRQTITAIDTTGGKTNENRSKKKRSWTRAVFSNLQRKGLEITFNQQKYITKPERRKLALRLGLSDGQVKVWFQNRRMKFRQANSKEEQLIKGKKTIDSDDEIDVVAE